MQRCRCKPSRPPFWLILLEADGGMSSLLINIKFLDVLANRDRIPCHRTSCGHHPDEARRRNPSLLRHRACATRGRDRNTHRGQRCRGCSSLQTAVAQYGTYRAGRSQEVHGHLPTRIQRVLCKSNVPVPPLSIYSAFFSERLTATSSLAMGHTAMPTASTGSVAVSTT